MSEIYKIIDKYFGMAAPVPSNPIQLRVAYQKKAAQEIQDFIDKEINSALIHEYQNLEIHTDGSVYLGSEDKWVPAAEFINDRIEALKRKDKS